MAAFIIGGCGIASHKLQFTPSIDDHSFRCYYCRTVIEPKVGFYRCSECDHETCLECAKYLSTFYPTLTDAQVAKIAAQLEEDKKTLIPCAAPPLTNSSSCNNRPTTPSTTASSATCAGRRATGRFTIATIASSTRTASALSFRNDWRCFTMITS